MGFVSYYFAADGHCDNKQKSQEPYHAWYEIEAFEMIKFTVKMDIGRSIKREYVFYV